MVYFLFFENILLRPFLALAKEEICQSAKAFAKAFQKALANLQGCIKNLNTKPQHLEQIDTLSGIASEFSNFAQMPSAVNTDLNIKDVISDVLYLFKETDNVHFELDASHKDEYWVVADKDQLNRVFNNMIKNSIQAFDGGDENSIVIILTSSKTEVVIEVRDNGCGISEEEKDKIFVPNKI